ncbi:hypothetical protein KGF56_003807 [Candida oxycetoniae]|uniref:Uncharacterized protein n=1 Tax=Candida oxycetoniae TaxID=497107 RepID=A0AAI9WWM0_9ASCO|nr:uncharacterized protein KGF56_003807 [Candida oxycetoniae]KAI3403386.2 hypothetical protein KGF56_003807 [Candida oxycetoniae]
MSPSERSAEEDKQDEQVINTSHSSSPPSQPDLKPIKKQRKPQTEEEYQYQLSLWAKTGPQINTETWLYEDLDRLDNTRKVDRQKILHACEKAYYERDWLKCLEMCNIGEKLFGVDLNAVGEELRRNFENKGRKTKTSGKIERHIIELLNIKERCLSRIEERK